jgi:hypothetical protein
MCDAFIQRELKLPQSKIGLLTSGTFCEYTSIKYMLEMPGSMRKSTLNPKQVLRWGGI